MTQQITWRFTNFSIEAGEYPDEVTFDVSVRGEEDLTTIRPGSMVWLNDRFNLVLGRDPTEELYTCVWMRATHMAVSWGLDPQTAQVVNAKDLCAAISGAHNKLCVPDVLSFIQLDTSQEVMQAFGVKYLDRFQDDYGKFTVIGYEAKTKKVYVWWDRSGFACYTQGQWARRVREKLSVDDLFSYTYQENNREFSTLKFIIGFFPHKALEIVGEIMTDADKRKYTIQKFSQFYTLLMHFPLQAPKFVETLLKDKEWFGALVNQLNSQPKVNYNFVYSLLVNLNLVMDPAVTPDMKLSLVRALDVLTSSVRKANCDVDRGLTLQQFGNICRDWLNQLSPQSSLKETCLRYISTQPLPDQSIKLPAELEEQALRRSSPASLKFT